MTGFSYSWCREAMQIAASPEPEVHAKKLTEKKRSDSVRQAQTQKTDTAVSVPKSPIDMISDALVGINATVRPGVRVGAAAPLGAGAVAASDVPDGVIATGIPARSDGSPAPAPQERG